jgi:uncharacterized membrane protein
VVDWPGTVIAASVGGAIILVVVSAYLLDRHVPAVATAISALVLSRRYAAALAYIGGSIGTLVGADLLNLGRLQGLGAPVASIGGAGTFDGIFLTGVLAVFLTARVGVRRGADNLNAALPCG